MTFSSEDGWLLESGCLPDRLRRKGLGEEQQGRTKEICPEVKEKEEPNSHPPHPPIHCVEENLYLSQGS